MKYISKTHKGIQIELFQSIETFSSEAFVDEGLNISRNTLLRWRNKIYNYQNKILKEKKHTIFQDSLIKSENDYNIFDIDPFSLSSFSINFWRSNKSVHNGPAMYFVIDKLDKSQIILYIGETKSANNRWKGYHDCKNYINNYKETIAETNLKNHIDIRFFLDVPQDVKLRRKLEQRLIYLWLPPFNKETRNRWITTFTNN